MTKYRIRLKNGRVIGPFEKHQLFELKANGHLKNAEDAQVFPTGTWLPIEQADFYSELIDTDKTILQKSPEAAKEETFVIDMTKLRNQISEKEIDELEKQPLGPIEELTETVRLNISVEKNIENDSQTKDKHSGEDELSKLVYDEDSENKTVINQVAQEEIQRIKKLQKIAEEKIRLEEIKTKAIDDARKVEIELIKEKTTISSSDATQVAKFDQFFLLDAAKKEESNLEIELKNYQKIEKALEEDNKEEEEEEAGSSNKKKILIIFAMLAILYAILFPDEKPKATPFQHLNPQIAFPIPFDESDILMSKNEFSEGLELFNKGNYSSIIKSGMKFKTSYENSLENVNALSYMVRSYGEQLKYSTELIVDAQTLFNVIQSKRPFLVQNPNGVIGINLFYMAINKNDAALDVVQKYLKLNPKNVTEDLFAVYLQSLIAQGKIDLAKQFYVALEKAPNKNHYTYLALINYLLLNQEFEKAQIYVDEGIKKYPYLVSFYLIKADILIKNNNFKEAVGLIKKADSFQLEYNNFYKAKSLELKGLVYSFEKKPKEAAALFAKSLKIHDSYELRMKLADLESAKEGEGKINDLINESKAVKFLLQAKNFYEEKNYELALSFASKATDAFPGHIPSELFLAKVQLRLGLAKQSIDTLVNLSQKYPDNKNINIALVETYINTYKFNDARNRIQILSSSNYKDSWEFISAKAKLFLKMGDTLQAMAWLKSSININPLNDSDIFILSEILMRKSSYDSARIFLNKAIELDPINPDYRIAYAKMVYETQDDLAAIGYLLSLQKEFGENPKILSEIAIFYYRSGKIKDYQDIKEKLEKLPGIDKTLYEFLIKAALLDDRFADVPPLVEKLLAVEPGDLEMMMTAGRVLFENGKLVDAAKWFKRVQDKLPTYPKVLYYIAKIDFLSGNLDAALKKINENIKDNGETDIDLVFLAQIYEKKLEFTTAENLYKRAQKINSKSYDAMVGLADLSFRQNNHDLALDLYKRAVKQKSDQAIIHKKMGDVYRQLGQGTLAIEAYKMYLEMEPESPYKSNLEAYINLMK